MADILLFARVDILDPKDHNRRGTPRCVVIRTTSDLQQDVLQGMLISAIHAEYRRWSRGGDVARPPSLWQRWRDSLRALWPSRAMARKLPAAMAAARRRAF